MTESLPTVSPEERLLLHGLDYQRYVALSDLIEDRSIRCTYHRGSLELRRLPSRSRRDKYLIVQLLSIVAEEQWVEMSAGGSMTLRQAKADGGLEPDACWWIQHEAQMRGHDGYDPDQDPPPDLELEIEVSPSLLNRLATLAALQVPEVWRFDGQTIRIVLLGPDGKYHESARSQALPFLPVAELVPFVIQGPKRGGLAFVREFRDWVRDQIARGWPA